MTYVNRLFRALALTLVLGGALSLVAITDAIPAGSSVLVWTVDETAEPAVVGASNPGGLALLDGEGNLTPVLDLPDGTARVVACGERAVSPNGQYFVFYVGGDEGALYYMDRQAQPVEIETALRSVCLGGGTFDFAPNSSRFAFIDYEVDAGQSSFADGFLRVYDAAGASEVFSTESVTAFDIGNENVAFLNFFTNDRGEADEVAVQIWNGESDREVATLRPDDSDETGQCRYTSGAVNILPDGNLSLILGQRCDRTAINTWQLYTVNVTDRSATRAATEEVVGGYQSFARTNAIFAAPDGSGFLFTVPDGVTANTAGLFRVDSADLTTQQIVERQLVLPANTTPANATPEVSQDGRWLALVQTSPNAENSLLIFDMTDLSVPPITLSAGSAGDTVSAVEFTGDSSRLFAVVGGDDRTENAIVAINLSDGSDFRVERGRYNSNLVVSPDGSEIVIGDWQFLEDPNEPPFLNTVSIDVAMSATTVLYEGAVVEEGKVVTQSFAVPLAWRGSAAPAATE